MPTSTELETLLSRYIGVGNTWLPRLNLVRARLIDDGAWPGMTPRIVLTVYTDADERSIVTLPRNYIAILRGYVATVNPLCGGEIMGTNGVFNQGYSDAVFNHNFQEVPDYFCVFQEWTEPTLIRFKFEISEDAGTIYVAGTNDGAEVWTTITGVKQRREAVAYVGVANSTTASLFDAKGIQIVKPQTKGRVSVYSVDSDGTETIVAVYEPGELTPRWRRYRVPCRAVESDDYTYVAIVRLGYVPVVNSFDDVLPGNIGALRFGLSALLKEDAEDYARAEELWQLARDRLVRQSEGESEGTEDRVEVEDDMQMAYVGVGL